MTNEPKDNPDKVGYEKAKKVACSHGKGDYEQDCTCCGELESLALAEGRKQALKEVEEFLNEEISECERSMADISIRKDLQESSKSHRPITKGG